MARKTWSRRQFLASAAAAATYTISNSSAAQGTGRYDVVIVGAGISGCVAARDLVARGVDNLAILEARDRVGGRTINHDIGGGYIAEGGGQWVGPTQTAILALCEELGIGTFPTYLDGSMVFSQGGSSFKLPYSDSGPSALEKKIDALAVTVPLNAPWQAEKALEWDSISLADWSRQNKISAQGLESLSSAAALTLGTSPEMLSFLYFLYYVHSGGGLHDLESMRGGAQDSRIEGGSQIISLKIAEQLGDKVKLNSAVKQIVQHNDHVEIVSASGVYRAKQVVMAVMPGSCTKIVFQPALPEGRAQLQNRWVQSQGALKINVVYDEPFWRQAGLNGMASGDGIVVFTTDNSPPDGGRGVIMIFASDEKASTDPEKRRMEVITELGGLFGAKGLEPIGYHEMDWGKEEFTAGCVSPLAPGVLTQYGASLRPSIGRIHWAGTEASEVWTGYMDGAVRAGKSVAKKLIPMVKG